MKRDTFLKTVLRLAVPITLQSLLQSSFGVIDQVMTGQLGSTNITGIGLGGKFSSLYSVLISAIAAAAGIMIAQYIGSRDARGVKYSFWVNIGAGFAVAAVFLCVCSIFPEQIMGIYTDDSAAKQVAARYLRIVSWSYLPMAAGTLSATMMRCMEAARLPLYAGICAAAANTILNYVLIFGKWGFPRLEAAGAAWATVISQVLGCILTVLLFPRAMRQANVPVRLFGECSEGQVSCRLRPGIRIWRHIRKDRFERKPGARSDTAFRSAYLGILLPILACEFLWSLGENVYAGIYGHIGTQECAAMTLTTPVQVLFMGALSGVSQAAGILTGKTLGSGAYEKAYRESKKLMKYGLAGALMLSVCLLVGRGLYLQIYQVEEPVKEAASQILFAFAVIAPVKVLNMILGGGIIRSGGKTKYVMWIDLIGTWGFGVPLGFLSAFVLKLPIPYVYFILSLEECVRLAISAVVFRRRGWMECLAVL